MDGYYYRLSQSRYATESDCSVVDKTLEVRQQLAVLGTPIGNNDAAIAAHALTTGCIIVTENYLLSKKTSRKITKYPKVQKLNSGFFIFFICFYD